jgi:hypothetical protein
MSSTAKVRKQPVMLDEPYCQDGCQDGGTRIAYNQGLNSANGRWPFCLKVPNFMNLLFANNRLPCLEHDPSSGDGEIVEMSLLLPAWQAVAVEAAAHSQGLTAAQMVRRMLQEYFCKTVHSV